MSGTAGHASGRWTIPSDVAIEGDPDDVDSTWVLRASNGAIMRLPQVGLIVWQTSPRAGDADSLVALLAEENAWSRDEIAQPVQDFVASLVAHGLLEEKWGDESN